MKTKATFLLLMILSATAAWADPHAFPVPFIAQQHDKIWFTDLPDSGTIKIFTINGEEVISLPIPNGLGQRDWTVINSAGKNVASGVYLFRVEGPGESKNGKLVIIR